MSQRSFYFVLAVLALWINVSSSEHCDRPETSEGCTVTAGHARCVARDLTASIRALPACTTNITFQMLVSDEFVITDLSYVDFSHLSNLHELLLYSNRDNHSHVPFVVDRPDFIPSLQNVRALKLHALQESYRSAYYASNAAMYRQFKSLDVLEFMRAQRVGLANVLHVIGQKPNMRKLVLKNVQELNHETYTPMINLTEFICGSEVRHLDLSYNDIVSLQLDKACFEGSMVQYLNLKHNNLVNFIDKMDILPTYTLFPNIITVHGSVRTKDAYQHGLWDDEDIIEDYDQKNTTPPKDTIPLAKPIKAAVLHLVKSIMHFDGEISDNVKNAYGFWIKDMISHCILSQDQYDVGKLISLAHSDDVCAVMKALGSKLNTTNCPEDPIHQFAFFTKQMCKYEHCTYRGPLPIPPFLTSVSYPDMEIGRYHKWFILEPEQNQALCVHPHNNLQHVNIPNIRLTSLQRYTGSYNISGFQHLRYLNAHGHKLPVLFAQLTSVDMYSLEELHIGGSVLTTDGVIRSHMLRPYTRLSLLNMTDANLVRFEPDVFLEHKNLTVLDLSHNHLNATSLAVIDFSQTRIRSLNLSHNQFTTIPAALRGHLDRLEGLQLYLSGNRFLCNCDNLEFLQWVQKSSSITFHYAGDHVCADAPGNTIHNIVVDSLYCNWYWQQPLIAVGSSLALSLLCGTAFVIYKKRWYISNLKFRFQERFCFASEDTPAVPYTYDAFVLYSSVDDDRQWVHLKLVQELENVYSMRLCIHHRDFLGGCAIVDSIDKAIRCSRKVLVVMSENFLRSDWCLEEFSMTASTDRRKLVVIMYKDVMLADVLIPTVVRHTLESTTYIEWDEDKRAQQLFWKKLRRALYKKQPAPSQQSHDQQLQEPRDQCLLLSDVEASVAP